MVSFQEFFKWGLDREIPELLTPPKKRHLNAVIESHGVTCPGMCALAGRYHQDLDHINLGPGNRKIIRDTIGVGRVSEKLVDLEWEATFYQSGGMNHVRPLPFGTETVGSIHVHQFMEHFECDDALAILRECERVLVPGGVIFMTTPYPGHGHFTQALDHKSMWTEETWQWLFENDYYNHEHPWQLRVHACYMAGVVYRNLDLFTQLVKGE